MALFDEIPFLQSEIIDNTRTAYVNPVIGKGIGVGFNGELPTAGGAIYGITLTTEEVPGTRASVTAPANIAVQAYVANDRFVLTAAQAVNAGGRAGIYQVITGFTPVATTLTAAEAANIFYVGSQLTPDHVYKYGNSSRVHAQDAYRPGYQYYRSLAITGSIPCQTGAAVTRGQRLMIDAAGKVVVHTGTNTVVGYAVNDAAINSWVNVELRLG